jgi:acetate kinase
MLLLTVNAGSSSIRLQAMVVDSGAPRRLSEYHGERGGAGAPSARDQLAAVLAEWSLQQPTAVAHRIVHGGARLVRPSILDHAAEEEIERLSPLAPLHNPAALEWIRACRAVLGPGTPQVGVFDTAFYAGLPAIASTYAIPRDLAAKHGIKRYGFHGIAHQAMERRWRATTARSTVGARVISFQLGAGCSVTAIRDGQPVDTSMGFSPLEGLVMATRSGDLDPGLLLYLEREAGFSTAQLERLLNEESGLHGLSGMGGDMRALLASDRPEARRAIEIYVYRARKYLGGYLAALGGADAILFGGGVGENAPSIRAMIVADLGWAGVALDDAKHQAAAPAERRIDASSGNVEVWVIPVDEATTLAREAMTVLASDR